MTRLLYAPVLLWLALSVYLTIMIDANYAIWLAPPVILMAIIYVMTPQINWWWYQRYPPEPHPRVTDMIQQFMPFYSKLDNAGKKHFRSRVAMYMEGIEFMPKGFETVPPDIKAAIAMQAVRISYGQDDFLMYPFERIVVYPHPFPSPQFPQKMHHSELYHGEKDNEVLLFSAEHLMTALSYPTRFYNIVLHEFAKVYMITNKKAVFPELPEEDAWAAFEQISGFSKAFVEQCIGLPNPNPLAVSIVMFFDFPSRCKTMLPDLFQYYENIFNVNPLGGQNPIV